MKKIQVWTQTAQETEEALARLTSAYGNGEPKPLTSAYGNW